MPPGMPTEVVPPGITLSLTTQSPLVVLTVPFARRADPLVSSRNSVIVPAVGLESSTMALDTATDGEAVDPPAKAVAAKRGLAKVEGPVA